MPKANILGKLQGIIASAREKSRNNRVYTEEFWDRTFDSELFQEGLNNKVFLGQLYHPDDNEEYNQIHLDDRSAVVLTDVKKKGLDYIGTFEILPTKAGQCLRNLLDVGVIFGVSSRGLSDVDRQIFDGSAVEGYDLITWDLVAFPGIKSCRLHEIGNVAENYKIRQQNKTLIMESLNKLKRQDKYFNNYINKTLKLKEDFDDSLQVEDILARLGVDSDYIDNDSNFVIFSNKDNLPYYNGPQGNKEVISFKDIKGASAGDVFLVDNLTYSSKLDAYISTGDWLYMGNKNTF